MDLVHRKLALELLSSYITYKKWYVKFVYDTDSEIGTAVMGAFLGDRNFFNALGPYPEDFFSEQDAIRAKNETNALKLEIPNEDMADNVLARVIGLFDWDLMEFALKGTITGAILGQKSFLDKIKDKTAKDDEDDKDEVEAPKGIRPKLKADSFVDERGNLLYWN